jgi:Lon protease-like protein
VKIPLFPLNLVMFPGAKYPLHIFEERYKRLVNKCLATDDGFGIVLRSEEEISDVGCFVRISRILKRYDNGNLDIIVAGLYRFKVIASQHLPDGLIEAEIEEYSDEEDFENFEALGIKALDQFQQIISKTELFLSDSFWNNLSTAKKKSFKLAEKSGLNTDQQKQILVMQSESKRLQYLIKHFSKVNQYLEKSETLKDIIAGDGYINE